MRKIEASEKEGRMLFNKTPNIDAGKLIQLIQSQPKIFRFDGQEKLRFSMPLPEFTERAAFIGNLINEIAVKAE